MSNKSFPRFYVEEHTVRIIAFQVAFLTMLILYTHNYWLALALAFDFALRAFTHLLSPLAFLVKVAGRWVSWMHKPVFAQPKKFAAGIGFAFSLTICVLFYFHFIVAAYIFGAILLFCATLESCFNVCVGCYVYDWVIAPFKK